METVDRIRIAGWNTPHIPFPSENRPGHVVLFYKKNEFLFEGISQFLGKALSSGDPAVVIGTQEHIDGLGDRLYRRGLDVSELIEGGSYIEVDAAEILPEILAGDAPDPERFNCVIGSLLMRIKNAARHNRPVAVYCEMSALLWQESKKDAAIRLEQLWNDPAYAHSISMCCAYSLESFPGIEDEELFHGICKEHTAVVPAEGYSELPSSDQRLRNVACLQQKSQALVTQARLRRIEGHFRKLVEAVQDYAIYTLDTHGYVTTWNAGANRIFGYSEPEILGQHFSRFFTEEDVLAGKPAWELQITAKEGRFEGEGWRLRKDGWKFLANVVFTPIRGNTGAVTGFAAVTRDISECMLAQDTPRLARDSILESEKSIRQFSLLVMRRQEEERRRVGEDLVDNLGQYLSVLKMKLDSMCPFTEERESKSDEELAQCLTLVEESIKEVRAVSYLLYPPLLEELGLRSAIPWYLDGFKKRSGITTTFQISHDFRRLSNDANVAIYRVLQEALTNVQLHSGSSTADIRLLIRNETVVLIVSDAGKGMPPELLSPNHRGLSPLGMGLRGMSERMRYLGGRLEIKSSGKGVTIIATIPVACCAASAKTA